MTTTECRRCSECVGQKHHWIENFRLSEAGDPYYICKHCDAACVAVDDEHGFSEPSGVLYAQPRICDGCDWYARDCECDDGELNDGVDTSSYSREDELLDEDLERGESDYEDCP